MQHGRGRGLGVAVLRAAQNQLCTITSVLNHPTELRPCLHMTHSSLSPPPESALLPVSALRGRLSTGGRDQQL